MRIILENFRWYKPFIILLIISHLIGCAKWSVIEKPQDRYILENEPEWIEIELYTGKRVIMKDTFIMGDSLKGIREHVKGDQGGSLHFEYNFSVHLNEIKQW